MADVKAAYRAGLRVFKVKIGRDIQTETETIRRLIETYPAAQFYVDANETLPSAEAADILDGLFELGALYCEEPLPVRWLREIGGSCGRSARCRLSLMIRLSRWLIWNVRSSLTASTFSTSRRRGQASPNRGGCWTWRGKRARMSWWARRRVRCWAVCTRRFSPGMRTVNCPSECSFYLKTEADLTLAPPIVDGYMELDAVDAALTEMQAVLAQLT